MIIKEAIGLNDIWDNHNHYYEDMVKFCVDRKRKVVAIDADMHIDLEYELYDDGSDDRLGIGCGRELSDPDIIDELSEILKEWIK